MWRNPVAAHALGACVLGREGSSPSTRTKAYNHGEGQMRNDHIKVRREEIGRCKFCHEYQIDPKIHQDRFVCDNCWRKRINENQDTYTPAKT